MTNNNSVQIIETINGLNTESAVNNAVIEYLHKYISENPAETRCITDEIVSWDGSLDYLEVWNNDEEFFELFYEGKPAEVARAIYFGNYDYNAEYIRLNDYGNIETLTEYEHIDELNQHAAEIVEGIMDNWYNIGLSDELEEVLKAWDERVSELV